MGYTTDFNGEFMLDKPLAPEDLDFLNKLNQTRRMKRNVGPEFGVDGEFYVAGDGDNYLLSDDELKPSNIVNHNTPPNTQPGLWCGWRPNDNGTAIEWDGGEKFYEYVAWIQYLITKILAPRGYSLTGDVHWQGEDSDDKGKIVIKNNKVKVLNGYTYFSGQPRKRLRAKRTKLQEVAWIEKRIAELKTKKKNLVNG